MSMHVDFPVHSYYMGFAIRDNLHCVYGGSGYYHGNSSDNRWSAFTVDGMNYHVIERDAYTLKRLKEKIRRYHLRKHNGYGERIARRRLEELRTELREERISYSELAELAGLSSYIDKNDVELLEVAGVPEGSRV